MTVHSLRHGAGWLLAVAALVAVAAWLGNAIYQDLENVILLVVLLVAVVVMFVEPFWALLLLVAAVPLESQSVMQPGTTGLKAVGVLLFGVWFFRRLYRGEPWKPLLFTPFTLVTMLFVALALASSIWAVDRFAALRGVMQLCMLAGLSVLVIDLVRSWDRVDLVAKGLVIGGTIGAYLTLQDAFAGARRASMGGGSGVNGTAVILLAVLPFAFYLLRGARGTAWRLLGLIYVPMAVAAIALTFSRMVFLLTPLVLLVLFWQTLRGRRGRALLLSLIGVLAWGAVAFIPWDLVGARADTIPEALGGMLSTKEEGLSTYSGRGYHMQVALRMGLDHPVLGAGYNSFGRLFRDDYQYTVAGAGRLYGSYRSPHSSWPGVFAELGTVGVLLWAGVLASVLLSVLKARSATRLRGGASGHACVQTITLVLLLYMGPYSLYLPIEEEKLLWALLGLGLAVARLVREPVAPPVAGGPEGGIFLASGGLKPAAAAMRNRAGQGTGWK